MSSETFNGSDEYSLSHGQEALWLLHKCAPDTGVYNVDFVWEIPDSLDIDLVRRALQVLIDRHPVLRSVFIEVDGQPKQKITPHINLVFEYIKVEANLMDEELAADYLDKELHRPFDLSNETSMRWYLIQRPGRKRILGTVIHHINVDLWSLMILANELRHIYSNLLHGHSVSLKEPSRSFFEFVTGQNEFIASEAGEKEKAFWLAELDGINTSLNLPVDYPRPQVMTCNGGYYRKLLRGTERFNQIASTCNVSLFSLYFSVYFLLLYKYTGQSDLAVGTATAGRGDEFSEVFGYFVNTVIVRGQVDVDKKIIDFIRLVDGKTKGAIKHQNYPLANLSKSLDIDRTVSEAALIQTTFAWENINRFENREQPLVEWPHTGERLWDMGDMGEWKHFDRRAQLDNFDLTFKIYKFKSDFFCGVEYNSDIFKESTIERMVEHFSVLMAQFGEGVDKSISQLSILTESESNKILGEWVDTSVDYDKSELFHDIFSRRSSEFPELPALIHNSQQYSYHSIDHRANELACFLVERGVVPDQIVGVSTTRSPDMIVAILAILKAGGAYLPLDPDYPSDRLSFMIKDACLQLIISHSRLSGRLPPHSAEVVNLDESWDKIQSDFCGLSPIVEVQPTNLAYVIYTSGSTGNPKGVLVEHAQLCHFLTTLREVFSVEPEDRVLQFATLNFDASVMTIGLALQSGASLFLAEKEALLGDALLDCIRANQLSLVMVPPSVLAALEAEHFPSLKYLMVAGEPCSATLANRWAEKGHPLHNVYGPTECTVWATTAKLYGDVASPIGKALANTRLYILDSSLNPVPTGIVGEIHISGGGLSRGYLNRPELTAEKFIDNPFSNGEEGFSRLYKTGDLGRYLPSGEIECLGRIDHQVKIRGYRVELGEIESVLLAHEAVNDVLVMARDDFGDEGATDTVLVAYVVAPGGKVLAHELRSFLKELLPDFMVPASFMLLDAFPLTPNEKIDRKALPKPTFGGQSGQSNHISPRNETETILSNVWKDVLKIDQVSVNENFFDLGGHSLLLAQVFSKIPPVLRERLSMVDLFKYPTIQSLAHYLDKDEEEDEFFLTSDEHIERMRLRRRLLDSLMGIKIAVIGLSGRFPGANTVEEFWQNIAEGKETIRFFERDELQQAGVPDSLLDHRNYVPAQGALDDVKHFDADFFGFSPREAQITDPQQRLFLECAWEALEDAGCVPDDFPGRIGVYGGVGLNNYMIDHLAPNYELMQTVGDYPVSIGNDKDFLCTRVSYKLNLNGPAMVVQTACSTSLVAVHNACQALINEECDIALAGGVSLGRLEKSGYLFQEGMIMSPDGHCRAFDADAAGTVQGQGAGIVVLRRLDDAMKRFDNIYAVIKGSGINNDGSNKPGYTAPAVEGQAKAIMLAQASADVAPVDISYIETHGTGTSLGDPIEIEGLKQAFNANSNISSSSDDKLPKQYCAIGSLKPNVGHLDAASGVAGLIKTIKALQYKKLPPSLHYKQANSKIDFENSPFYVNTELVDWPNDSGFRHAGISAFGIGGTNAHIILRESPSKTPPEKSRPWEIVALSARTPEALEQMSRNLVRHLKEHPEVDFSDTCYTLLVGRKRFAHRRYLICRTAEEAVAELESLRQKDVVTALYQDKTRRIGFMFSGQGSQYVGMGKHLYKAEVGFREEIDRCRTLLKEKFVYLYEELEEDDFLAMTEQVHQTFITQPLLFTLEYALAKTLISWGIEPSFMIGHSLGEYVAACLAGVFTLEQALEVVAIRGKLIQELPEGDMLTVELPEDKVLPYLNDQLSLAAVNGPSRCVISGDREQIYQLQARLQQKGIRQRILHTSHAFHSHMMEPILQRFEAVVARRQPQAPQIPFVSSVTGDWIRDEQATDPAYWASQLRREVRFHQGLETLFNGRRFDEEGLILLELGPGSVLTTLARQHPLRRNSDLVKETMRHAQEEVSDTRRLLQLMGRLWANDVSIDWETFYSARQRYKVSLPSYPFQRQLHWVEPAHLSSQAVVAPEAFKDQGGLPGAPVTELKAIDSSAPRDEVEQIVTQEWQRLLGLDRVGIYDNFFDLGGDSLLAVSLVDRLMGHFDTPIATHILIQKPTIEELADYIKMVTRQPDAETEAQGYSPLVMIQRGEEGKKPLFMVHPIGGEVYFYRDLALHLGTDQPVYAFQAPSLSGSAPPFESVSVMATAYLEEMRRIGAKPPYLLGGSSFGGLVAYEMAQQIKATDEDVAMLVMIDTPAPEELPTHLTDGAAILNYLLKDKMPISVEVLRKLEPQAQIDYILEEARLLGDSHILPPHLGVPLFNTWIAHQQATFAYEPLPYDGYVVYFRHTEPMEYFPAAPQQAWQAFVERDLEVHQVPGNHVSMNYPPHVRVLAAHLKGILMQLGGREEDSWLPPEPPLLPQTGTS